VPAGGISGRPVVLRPGLCRANGQSIGLSSAALPAAEDAASKIGVPCASACANRLGGIDQITSVGNESEPTAFA